MNIVASGSVSGERTLAEYAKNIWHVEARRVEWRNPNGTLGGYDPHWEPFPRFEVPGGALARRSASLG